MGAGYQNFATDELRRNRQPFAGLNPLKTIVTMSYRGLLAHCYSYTRYLELC